MKISKYTSWNAHRGQVCYLRLPCLIWTEPLWSDPVHNGWYQQEQSESLSPRKTRQWIRWQPFLHGHPISLFSVSAATANWVASHWVQMNWGQLRWGEMPHSLDFIAAVPPPPKNGIWGIWLLWLWPVTLKFDPLWAVIINCSFAKNQGQRSINSIVRMETNRHQIALLIAISYSIMWSVMNYHHHHHHFLFSSSRKSNAITKTRQLNKTHQAQMSSYGSLTT